MKKEQNLFVRLTKLFRSGPVIKRKIKNFDSKNPSYASSLELFKRSHSDVYSSTLSAYGSFDRMSRYSDFAEMEATPEITSALDIYAEECTSADDKGNALHVYSENRKILEILENLFHETLNIEFNLSMWVRNLCKYGDFFLFLDVHPEFGVTNAFPIPISEIEREEGFDKDDPAAVRYRWITQGNQILENWQVVHFRLLGNDAFLPYGSSVLEGARRIWRQLILIEDAMLVYRVVRSPDRRVFYIDVGNVPPEEVGNYIEQAKTSLKRNQIIDKNSGRVDLRYNPMSVDEDYFLPVRGSESGTKIDTLAGGQNASAIEDVQYIQKKLFAALKIPKAYLGYDEDVGAKATLAQEDIRFSRTIARIQKTIIAELNKIAMIHLYIHGYDSEDLVDFDLKLSNPSSIAQQQKLQLIQTRFEIASNVPDGLVSKSYIRKNILELTDDQIKSIITERIADTDEDKQVEVGTLDDDGKPKFKAPAGEDVLSGQSGLEFGSNDTGSEESPSTGEEESGDLFAGDVKTGQLLTAMPKSDSKKKSVDIDDEDMIYSVAGDDDIPVRALNKIMNSLPSDVKSSKRKSRSGETNKINLAHIPDFAGMLSTHKPGGRKQGSLSDTYDLSFMKNPFGESIENESPLINQFLGAGIAKQTRMTRELQNTLNHMSNTLGSLGLNRRAILKENDGSDDNVVGDDIISINIDDLMGSNDDE